MTTTRSPLWRQWHEFRSIGQDPVLALGLIAVGAFVLLFVALPLLLVIWEGFFDPVTGQVSLKYFTQFFDPYYMPHLWGILRNTLVMGIGAATGGTLIGFIFAYALMRCRLVTGRMHQIRVHLAARGWPLLGDPVYGRDGAGPAFPRQALHAWRVAFTHPVTSERMEIAAPVPEDLRALLAQLMLPLPT